ncbi:MAG: DUF3991 and toprim domain-containing protein [Oscillospiraceae bacterium]|nr:DUF3991 and toprim domain-containing protein [Oscillospiraceae bacterium]
MPYIHLTEEQKQAAGRTDLAAFLISRGEKVRRSGSEYEWVDHHVTLRGNMFFNHYEQRGGNATTFVREQFGLSYPEAVQLLLGESVGFSPVTQLPPKEQKAFVLPPKNDNMRRVYAYLIKQRGISREVIYHFAHKELIYQDSQYNNAIFVGTDKDGVPRHAHKKSTISKDGSFRANQEGSVAAFSFAHIGKSAVVHVYESPIDMLSYLTLHSQDWEQDSHITLCSVADHALFQRLKDYPRLREVVVCLDNDEAGRLATERIAAKLHEQGYDEVSAILPRGKDWNEELVQLTMDNGELTIKGEGQGQKHEEGKMAWKAISM